MPTLMQSAPRVDQRLGAVGRGDVAGDQRHAVGRPLDARNLIEHRLGMAVRRIHHDAVDAGVDQRHRSLEAFVADGGGGGDAQAPLAVLAGVGVLRRLLDVLDGEQADAAEVVVDHQQLLQPVLVQQAARLLLADNPSRTVMTALVISSLTGWPGPSAKRTSRLVRMPTSRVGVPGVPPRSTTGKPEMPCRFIRATASASVSSGKTVMGFTTMPLS